MSRKRVAIKRDVLPDPKYGSPLVSSFINAVMLKGKKSLAERLVYKSLELASKKANTEPIKLFTKALDNVKPSLEVKSRRVGGSTYQVPVEVSPNRRTVLASRWIIHSARNRGERGFENRLSGEFLDAYNKTGSAVRKKEDTHKMAEANKAFSHYRW